MSKHQLSLLRNTAAVTTHRGIDAERLAQCESRLAFRLPADHVELLRWSNGLEAYYGFFRLFGVHSNEGVDAVVWNDPDSWKFAWDSRCLPYWCFGETAWGDQYAYRPDLLNNGNACPVYFLDCAAMTPKIIAPSFTQFLEKEFLRNAKDPYDQMTVRARQKFGSLDVGSHLVYIPSILLGGTEDIGHVQKMNGRAAMICNGDIAIQIDNGPINGTVSRVDTYDDAQGRTRLRLVWC
jgi:hypothetical protein